MNISPHGFYTPKIRFSGAAATQTVCEAWVEHPDDLCDIAKKDKNPYIGTLPDAFLPALGATQEEAFIQLDALVNRLRQALQSMGHERWQSVAEAEKSRWLDNLTGDLPVSLKHLPSRGLVGDSFGLTVNGFRVNLKIYPFDEINYVNDIANAAYLTALGTSDVSQFHGGNPLDYWLLTEFIDEDTDIENRPGKPLHEHGFEYWDSEMNGNRVRGIIVDHGALVRLDESQMKKSRKKKDQEPLNLKLTLKRLFHLD